MMHGLEKWLLVAGALLLPPLAAAADGAGNYAIWGVGGRSCNQFGIAAHKPAELASYRDYVMGYLTAFNALAPDTYDAVGEPLEVVLTLLGDYCDAHQIESFERAIAQLIVARNDSRLRQPPGANRGWGGAGPTTPAIP